MAKKSNKKKFSKRSTSQSEIIMGRIDRMSRFSRIVLNIGISLAAVVAVAFPIVLFFDSGANELGEGDVLYTPIIIVAVVWLIIYAFGWAALVGFELDLDNPWKAGKPAVTIVIIGIIATCFAVLEIIMGLLFGLFL
jgi:hypothetical protein